VTPLDSLYDLAACGDLDKAHDYCARHDRWPTMIGDRELGIRRGPRPAVLTDILGQAPTTRLQASFLNDVLPVEDDTRRHSRRGRAAHCGSDFDYPPGTPPRTARQGVGRSLEIVGSVLLGRAAGDRRKRSRARRLRGVSRAEGIIAAARVSECQRPRAGSRS